MRKIQTEQLNEEMKETLKQRLVEEIFFVRRKLKIIRKKWKRLDRKVESLSEERRELGKILNKKVKYIDRKFKTTT